MRSTIYEAMRCIEAGPFTVRLWIEIPAPKDDTTADLVAASFPTLNVKFSSSSARALEVIEQWAFEHFQVAAVEVLDRETREGSLVYFDWP